MQQNNIHILCTRPLDDLLIKEVNRKGIYIDVFSFIKTEAIENENLQKEIEQSFLTSATVVFTSMNAVEAIADKLKGQQPNWNIYCIGTTTNKLVEKYFGKTSVTGTACNAAELAKLIVEKNNVDEVIFFCGDQRRDELPDILRKNNIAVKEIVVYQTLSTPHKITKEYNGILFFSPSAVESFFSNNTIIHQTILFAIGNTTADTIKKFSANKIIIAGTTGKENLVEQMIEYFTRTEQKL